MILSVNEVLAEPEEDSRLEHTSSCRLDSKRTGKNGDFKQGSSCCKYLNIDVYILYINIFKYRIFLVSYRSNELIFRCQESFLPYL